MSKQNIYDNEIFFQDFSTKRVQEVNFNNCLEAPVLFSMLPDLAGKRLLDIGCGMGQHAKKYAQMGSNVLGIDISEKMLAYAVEDNSDAHIRYRRLAMEDLDTLEERFDILTSSLVFDYVEDFAALMKTLHSLLVPGGVLVFSTSHPMATCADGTYDRFTRTESGKRLYANIHNYALEGKRVLKWVVEEYELYHHTLATMINAMICAGFTIQECKESCASEELRFAFPGKFDGTVHRPEFIFFRCQRS